MLDLNINIIDGSNTAFTKLKVNTQVLAMQLESDRERIESLLKPMIIVYSGMCDDKSVEFAMKCGSDKYMFKPSTVAQFKDAI